MCVKLKYEAPHLFGEAYLLVSGLVKTWGRNISNLGLSTYQLVCQSPTSTQIFLLSSSLVK